MNLPPALQLFVLIILVQSVRAAPPINHEDHTSRGLGAPRNSNHTSLETDLERLIDQFIVEKTNYKGNDAGILNLLRFIGREVIISERFPSVATVAPTTELPQELVTERAVEECPICYTPLADSDIIVTQCGHKFHGGCLDQWFHHSSPGHRTCPMCRTPLQDTTNTVQFHSHCDLCDRPNHSSNATRLPCGHEFHRDCLRNLSNEYLRRGITQAPCPICGDPLPDMNIDIYDMRWRNNDLW